MKLTKLPKEVLVMMVAKALAESAADDSRNDIVNYIFNLEVGNSKPVCTWTKQELMNDIVADAVCFGCDVELTQDETYATDDDSRDIVCKKCHDS